MRRLSTKLLQSSRYHIETAAKERNFDQPANMSPKPIQRDETIPQLGAKAVVPSSGEDAQVTSHELGQCVVEPLEPETNDTNDRSPSDGEAVRSSTKSETGKTQRESKETSSLSAATLPPMALEKISSQAIWRGSAIRSSSDAGRRARRASPYDVEGMRLHLADTSFSASTTSSAPSIKISPQPPRTSSLESTQISQEPTTLTLLPQTHSIDVLEAKETSDTIADLTSHTTEQKMTELEKALRRRWGDIYPKATATQVVSSGGEPLDMLRHGKGQGTKQKSPDMTPKFELSLSGQTAFAADPLEMPDISESPEILAADQVSSSTRGIAQTVYEGVMPQFMSLTLELPHAGYRYGDPLSKAAEQIPGRSFATEADMSRAYPDTSRVGRLVICGSPNSHDFFPRGLRTRPLSFGIFPERSRYGRTEAEGNDPAVDGRQPSGETRPWVQCSFDRELDRISGKIEMLEIIVDLLRTQLATIAFAVRKLERWSGQ